jgi:hypothetical protein
VTDTLVAGFDVTSYSAGTKSSGTYTPAVTSAQANWQHATNNGAHTLAPPATCCSMVIEYTNGVSAGTITTSSFTYVAGDTPTTTNGHKFLYCIMRSNSYSLLTIRKLQ